MSDLLRSLMTKEDHGQIAQVAHDKRATVSDSLRSLMIKEANEQITRLLVRSQKTSDLLKTN